NHAYSGMCHLFSLVKSPTPPGRDWSQLSRVQGHILPAIPTDQVLSHRVDPAGSNLKSAESARLRDKAADAAKPTVGPRFVAAQCLRDSLLRCDHFSVACNALPLRQCHPQ